jgi:hypothetical protein
VRRDSQGSFRFYLYDLPKRGGSNRERPRRGHEDTGISSTPNLAMGSVRSPVAAPWPRWLLFPQSVVSHLWGGRGDDGRSHRRSSHGLEAPQERAGRTSVGQRRNLGPSWLADTAPVRAVFGNCPDLDELPGSGHRPRSGGLFQTTGTPSPRTVCKVTTNDHVVVRLRPRLDQIPSPSDRRTTVTTKSRRQRRHNVAPE